MRNQSEIDFNRRELDFRSPKVAEVLPEYFQADYPTLITLLETYYDYLDSDGTFNDDLRGLLRSKDIDGVSIRFLDYLMKETGGGLSADNFSDPREALKNFPNFFRTKGSLLSVQHFFRALYGEEPEIVYPKDFLFIVGESKCGAESLKYIQNGALYQTLSVLVKSSIPISTWRTLYKELVHPAGFYLGGEVLLVETATILPITPTSIEDSNANNLVLAETATSIFTASLEPLTAVIADSSGNVSVSLETFISQSALATPTLLDQQYNDIAGMATDTPPTFDIDSDGTNNPIDFSNENETFDKN